MGLCYYIVNQVNIFIILQGNLMPLLIIILLPGMAFFLPLLSPWPRPHSSFKSSNLSNHHLYTNTPLTPGSHPLSGHHGGLHSNHTSVMYSSPNQGLCTASCTIVSIQRTPLWFDSLPQLQHQTRAGSGWDEGETEGCGMNGTAKRWEHRWDPRINLWQLSIFWRQDEGKQKQVCS